MSAPLRCVVYYASLTSFGNSRLCRLNAPVNQSRIPTASVASPRPPKGIILAGSSVSSLAAASAGYSSSSRDTFSMKLVQECVQQPSTPAAAATQGDAAGVEFSLRLCGRAAVPRWMTAAKRSADDIVRFKFLLESLQVHSGLPSNTAPPQSAVSAARHATPVPTGSGSGRGMPPGSPSLLHLNRSTVDATGDYYWRAWEEQLSLATVDGLENRPVPPFMMIKRPSAPEGERRDEEEEEEEVAANREIKGILKVSFRGNGRRIVSPSASPAPGSRSPPLGASGEPLTRRPAAPTDGRPQERGEERSRPPSAALPRAAAAAAAAADTRGSSQGADAVAGRPASPSAVPMRPMQTAAESEAEAGWRGHAGAAVVAVNPASPAASPRWLQRHIWSVSRTLSWCADAEQKTLRPRTQSGSGDEAAGAGAAQRAARTAVMSSRLETIQSVQERAKRTSGFAAAATDSPVSRVASAVPARPQSPFFHSYPYQVVTPRLNVDQEEQNRLSDGPASPFAKGREEMIFVRVGEAQQMNSAIEHNLQVKLLEKELERRLKEERVLAAKQHVVEVDIRGQMERKREKVAAEVKESKELVEKRLTELEEAVTAEVARKAERIRAQREMERLKNRHRVQTIKNKVTLGALSKYAESAAVKERIEQGRDAVVREAQRRAMSARGAREKVLSGDAAEVAGDAANAIPRVVVVRGDDHSITDSLQSADLTSMYMDGVVASDPQKDSKSDTKRSSIQDILQQQAQLARHVDAVESIMSRSGVISATGAGRFNRDEGFASSSGSKLIGASTSEFK